MDHTVDKYVVEYDSNNSGGSWWLEDKDWEKLAKDGWHIHWVKNSPYKPTFSDPKTPDRFLGALATAACITITGASSESNAEEIAKGVWETSLGMDAEEEGCNCCGHPHSFFAWKMCSWEFYKLEKHKDDD